MLTTANKVIAFLGLMIPISIANALSKEPLNVTAYYVKANEATLAYHEADKADIQVSAYSSNSIPDRRTFLIDPSKHAQPYLGVGSSFEEASVYNFTILTSPEQRTAILKKLFSNAEQSFNWNLIRVTLGTSDFTPRVNNNPHYYTYDDNDGNPDPNLDHFNLNIGLEPNKIGLIQQVFGIKTFQKSNLILYASAWSPPAWMKKTDPNNKYESTNKKIIDPITQKIVDSKLIGGMLDTQYIDALAKYYLKTLLAYRSNGIIFYAMSEMNEPCVGDFTYVNYPNTCILPDDAKALLLAMKTNFKNNQIDTKVWLNDFNFGNESGIVNILDHDSEAAVAFDGIAYHSYYGRTDAMKAMLEKNYMGGNQPNSQGNTEYKGVYMSEFMTGWFWKGMELHNVPRIFDATRLLEYFHQGSSSYINWVTLRDERMGLISGALIDENGKLGADSWYSPNSVFTKDGISYSYDFMDYALGAIAKFVTPGGNTDATKNAYVLADKDGYNQFYDTAFEGSYTPTDFLQAKPENLPKVSQLSFENPDHSVVTVVVNAEDKPNDIRIIFQGHNTQYQILATVPAQSVETFKWATP